MTRSAALQTWPALKKLPKAVPCTARSTSASSRITVGPLPPSSKSSGLPAARAATRIPVSLLPVNPTASVPGWAAISSPTSAPGPVTRFTAPGGTPASSMHRISSTAMTEVVLAGDQTTVFPVARAAPRYSIGMFSGKFHGVMTA